MSFARFLSEPEPKPTCKLAWLFSHPVFWALILAASLFNLITLSLSDFTITFGPAINNLYFGLGCFVVSLLAHKKFPRFAIILATLAFFVLSLMQSMIAGYLGMSFGASAVDGTLAAIDEAVGFDWLWYLSFMNERPWFIAYVEWCYDALVGANIFALLYFLILNNNLRVQELLGTQAMMLAVTLFIGAFVPALGSFAYYMPAAELITNIPETAGRDFLPHLSGVLDGSMRSVSMNDMTGLVTFPSFHTSMALFLIWVTRRSMIFIPYLILNIGMLLGTPILGGHYLTDLVGGAIVTVGCIILFHKLFRSSEKPETANELSPAIAE